MPLSNELQSLVDQLKSNDPSLQIDTISVENALSDSGIDPNTATAEDFTSIEIATAQTEQQDQGQQQQNVGGDSAIDFSIDQAQKLIGGGIAGFGDLLGLESISSIGESIIQQQEEDIRRGGYQPKYQGSFSEQDGILNSLGWIFEKVQENSVSGAAVIAGTAAAAATAPVSAGLAAVIGGTTVVGGTLLGVGEVRQELVDKGVYDPSDAATAVGAGVLIGLLDRVGAGKVINKGGIIKGLVETGAAKSVGSSLITTAKAAGSEALTESLQELSVVSAAAFEGAEYTIPEVADRLIDAAVIGGTIGGVGSGISNTVKSVNNSIQGEGDSNANDNGTEGGRQGNEFDADDAQEGGGESPNDNDSDGSRQGNQQGTNGSEQNAQGDLDEGEGTDTAESNEDGRVENSSEESASQDDGETDGFVPQTFSKSNGSGYTSRENALRIGGRKASDAGVDDFSVVEQDDGTFIVVESQTETQQVVDDSESIQEFRSDQTQTPTSDNQSEELFDRIVSTRSTPFTDSIRSVIDAAESGLNAIGVGVNANTKELTSLRKDLSNIRSDISRSDSSDIGELQQRASAIQNRINTLSSSGASKAFNKLRAYVDVRLTGADVPREIRNAVVDANTERNAVVEEAQNVIASFNSAALSRSEQTGESSESVLQSYNSLINKIVVSDSADVDFKLVDPEQPRSISNITTNKDGDAVFQINGVDHAIPVETVAPTFEIIRLMEREHNGVLALNNARLDIINQNLQSSQEAIEEHIDLLISSQPDSGVEFVAFSNRKQRWVDSLFDSDSDGLDGLGDSIILDGLHEYISDNIAQNTEQHKDSIKEFKSAVLSSSSIDQFHQATDNKYIDSNGNTPVSVQAALGAYSNQSQASVYKNIVAERQSIKAHQRAADFILNLENRGPTHTSRVYEAHEGNIVRFIGARTNPKTDDERKIVNDYKAEIREGLSVLHDLEVSDPKLDLMVEQYFNDEIARLENKTSSDVVQSSAAATSSTRLELIFNKRAELTDARRAFLGEVTDPLTRIAYSINRQAKFRTATNMEQDILASSLGSGLFADRDSAFSATGVAPVKLEFNDPLSMGRLNGMYADPVLAEILKSFDGFPTNSTGLQSIVNSVSSGTKLSLAVLDPAVPAAGVVSGATLVAKNIPLLTGNFDIVLDEILRAANRVSGRPNELGSMDADLALAGGASKVQDIANQIKLSGGTFERIANRIDRAFPEQMSEYLGKNGSAATPISDAAGFYMNLMMGLHRFGEEVPQRVIYRARERIAKEKFGMSDSGAAAYATEVARNTSNFALFNTAFTKDMSQFPLVGTFTGWYTSMMRSTYEDFRQLYTDYRLSADKWARDNSPSYNNNDPEQVREAMRSYFGTRDFLESPAMLSAYGAASSTAFSALVNVAVIGGLQAIASIGDDEEAVIFGDNEMSDMISRLSPDYYKNIGKHVVSVSSDGKTIEFVNTSRLSNYGLFQEAFSALVNSDPSQSIDQNILNSIGTLVEPLTSLSFGVETLSEAATGRDQFGREIYAESDSNVEKLIAATGHVVKNTAGNGFIREGSDVLKSLVSDQDFNSVNGNEIKPVDFLLRTAGMKPIQFDVAKNLQQRVWQERSERTSSNKRFTSAVFSFNKLSSAEIQSEILRAEKANDRYFKSLISKVEAAKFFGMTDQEIAETLSSAGVSGYKASSGRIGGDVLLILRGKVPAYKFPEGSVDSFNKRINPRSISAEARSNVKQNIDLARSLVGG